MKKQETLEEAIKREYETRKFNSDFPFDPQSFKLGAKWQQEQQDCCTPSGQIKRYVDCVGCDKKPKQMSKLTAVEILELKLLGIVSFDSEVLRNKYKEQFKIAKAIEKEQMWDYIKKNYCIGDKSLEFHRLEFEKYYNETYKNEKK